MIQPHPLAPLGEVRTLPHYYPRTFDPTSAILCRNTAPLIAFAFDLIQHGIGVRVLGLDIGQGLVTTIRACKATSLDELEQKLVHRRNREARACRQQGNEQGASAVEDKYDCLNIFVQQAKEKVTTKTGLTTNFGLDYLEESINMLFDEKRRGLLTLSTVHKAKGLEWPTVFILDAPKLMPSRWANLPWQKTQEKNLQYVAITRAKLNCFYITSNCWRKESDAECQDSTNSETLACNPPSTFNPDTVEAAFQPSLSCDPSADNAWFHDEIAASVRATSNPDDENCQRRQE